MSAILDRQQQFFDAFITWGVEARRRGYKCTFGDAFRDPRASFPYSFPGTYHGKRLAVDVNLFKDGAWLVTRTGWIEMGEVWESLGGTWGGRWEGSKCDPNHLSWGEV